MMKTDMNTIPLKFKQIMASLAALGMLCMAISLSIEFFAREFFRLS